MNSYVNFHVLLRIETEPTDNANANANARCELFLGVLRAQY